MLMTQPAGTEVVVKDCAAAAVPLVRMYRAAGSGAVSKPAEESHQWNGIDCISGSCPFMFFPKPGFSHSFRGFLMRITGAPPKTA